MKDCDLIPINNQGANWEILRNLCDRDQFKRRHSNTNDIDDTNCGGLSLANEIKNQMLYYKVLQDKHDKSLINTLQDLNNMFKSGQNQVEDGGSTE